ncbi:MAG: sugar phosphate isomerase/epimerase [Lachnospiraceae bacterium]|nr:sugar phosphate isomerase/epimerase [Lachnospiraceae bacterium]
MRLSASNIGWKNQYDARMYEWMAQNGIEGLEIAPTRILVENPYDNITDAKRFAASLSDRYGLKISSMQSIWYGRQENIFASKQERDILMQYTKKAINFAEAIDCGNLVFGCPKNRNMPDETKADEYADIAVAFFAELGEYAYSHNTVLAFEANPPVYNTNFGNTTGEAIDLVKQINTPGFKLNLDAGTMIACQEKIGLVRDNIKFVNHVHISEPGLVPIEKRDLHFDLAKVLREGNYDGYVSLEMKTADDLQQPQKTLGYIKKVFG